ncbi:MAG: DUF4160 domain-containing protein [Lachnospiraceae bacterium]|nr:DUF4160 domain-containing protein [Lachnospiraceae bacterium]
MGREYGDRRFRNLQWTASRFRDIIGEEQRKDVAAVDIHTGEVLDGYLPPKVLAMVREWIDIHEKDLLDMWKTQEFKALPPLN